MARKTDGEKIDELEKLVATLLERLDNARDEIKEIKKTMEEASRRRWAFLPPVLSAIGASILTGIISFLIHLYFQPRP